MEIHELNTFSGALGSGDYFATDNGNDTSKVSAEALLAPLNERIDNIIAGPSSSAQEVIDARLGANGITYGSLGEAIRGQYDYLEEDFNGKSLSLVWIDGKFPNFNTGGIWDGPDYKYAKEVPVLPNGTYEYTGMTTGVCGICFLDENKSFIRGTNELTFTTPSNARYINIGTKKVSGLNPTLTLRGKITEKIIADSSMSTDKYTEQSFEALPGVITVNGAVQPDQIGVRAYFDCEPNQEFKVNGYYYDPAYPLVIFYNAEGWQTQFSPETVGYYEDVVVTSPYNAVRMVVQARNAEELKCAVKVTDIKESIANLYQEIEETNSKVSEARPFLGKKIVWLGMSIPANGLFGDEHPQAYPQQIGALLGANVINEAIGSSCIHCKDPARISPDNPYGFNTNFEASSRCLTNTQQEMDWICDHWNDNLWTLNKPTELSDWWKGKIHSFGYEQKIDKYLTEETLPDLFVFDHGFNDPSDPDNYYETYGKYSPYTFRGGMNFLIKRILSYNPYANIVIIGNYTTTRDVPEVQAAIAEDWSLPIAKQWENLGLSQTEEVVARGYWNQTASGYEWVSDSTERTYTIKDRLVPDHIHPHSNPTGKVVKKMADFLAAWLDSNVRLY